MNIKDAQKCIDLILNHNAMLAGQYPDGQYYQEFLSICAKYDIDPELHWEKCYENLMNPEVEGFTVNEEGEYVKN